MVNSKDGTIEEFGSDERKRRKGVILFLSMNAPFKYENVDQSTPSNPFRSERLRFSPTTGK